MNQKKSSKVYLGILLVMTLMLMHPLGFSETKKALTYQDIMKFREIHDAKISDNGLWVAYSAEPGRGDGQAVIKGIGNGIVFTIERGSEPRFTKDSAWAGMVLKPKAVEQMEEKKDKPKNGLGLLNLNTGTQKRVKNVKSFDFSEDSAWIAYHLYKEEEKDKNKEEKNKKSSDKDTGTTLILMNLNTEKKIEMAYVSDYAFDESSRFLACITLKPEGKENSLSIINLSLAGESREDILKEDGMKFFDLSWTEDKSRLAFTALQEVQEGLDKTSLYIWDGMAKELNEAVSAEESPKGWILPGENSISWSKDANLLYFGFKPREIAEAAEALKDEDEDKNELQEEDLYDVSRILEKRGVDVWHWDDPFINTHQKNMWPRTKEQTYLAVYHTDTGTFTQLADKDMPRVITNENKDYALGYLDAPYRKMITWYGWLNDLYLVDLEDGSRKQVVSCFEDRASLSPEGRFVVYYKDRHWYIFDSSSFKTRNLTMKCDVPFYNEDHDYPSAVPSYGVGGWLEQDRAVLIYDKYDIWKFPAQEGEPVNLTGGFGRDHDYTFRVIKTDPEKESYALKEKLLLSAYHNHDKNWGFYRAQLNKTGVQKLLEEQKKFSFIAKAQEADVILYTRESYTEFPDLWVSSLDLDSSEKVSRVNPQITEFAWGEAELVEWESDDGIPLQGVLIKPGNYEPGKRYPVVVYFYRFFSQRLHEFNQVVINHRPCFPFYASNGYAVFLPDIRFDIGTPGYSATKCLVPGIHKIIDMGVADPDAVGLHGHSWSGYQTAHVVTQTDIFKCAVAGAPVSNMTSSYGGIRWGSGMARLFQYEKTQSRIGASLWERRDLYIENSPLFFADRISTPLLIIFGDEDGAVPWYQGIELYLAMRRLQKDCVFLTYRGEPHHPQTYPNKLDWFKKMKEYFDHYLKGEEGPDWITKGVPYRGK
ncbi:MAG: prolyl oligopeptidase family serine peptidase [Candidatus Aminicenantes bacterium]|nr:prolyl oligopeptidase family serine peptidase [Candidatus Aminicenantes bacterium]